MKPLHILVIQMPDDPADMLAPQGNDLVGHDPRVLTESILGRGLHRNSEQQRLTPLARHQGSRD